MKMGAGATAKNERKFRECAWYTLYYVGGLTLASLVAAQEVCAVGFQCVFCCFF